MICLKQRDGQCAHSLPLRQGTLVLHDRRFPASGHSDALIAVDLINGLKQTFDWETETSIGVSPIEGGQNCMVPTWGQEGNFIG